ncbi:MAG TPA: MBL fold metallo-hydrolase [Gemmatimonadaceae bacterium]|nr:MBL fold metallo-hydrolase [Gemmatimonadaceae bacterium]
MPAHHDPSGGFRNPWTDGPERPPGGLLRWALVHRTTRPAAKDPPREPRRSARAARMSRTISPTSEGQLAITWIGHSTFLVQIGGRNVLTDPIWSERPSPLRLVGPRRRTRPGIELDDLPEVHAVLISHDHYDHLDAPTVRRLVALHRDAQWLAPLGVGRRLCRLGVRVVHELDWWQTAHLTSLTCECVPARHWSGRSLRDRGATLWCGWVIGGGNRRVYFAGDTALHPELERIGARAAQLDAALLPIGGYEPSWYMRHVHMSPEEAVHAYAKLRAEPGDMIMVPMHWGTFKLADEAIDEPPRRLREAWCAAGMPLGALWVPTPGETRVW